MRIGLFSDTYPPDVNGVANSTRILKDELRRHGHDVFVVATGMNEDTGWDEKHEVLRLAGIEIPQLYGYVVTTPFHIRALNEIRKLHLDLIHAQTEFGVGMFARICARQLNLPIVITYHTTYEDYTHYANPLNLDTIDAVARKAVANLSRLYSDTSTEVIVPSKKTKELLESYNVHTDIHIVPTGLELDRFSPEHGSAERTHEIRQEYGIADDVKMIVSVGRIAEEKSLDIVIEGFHLAAQSGCRCRLLIVGGGPDEEKLQRLVQNENLTGTVIFAGKKPADKIADYYRAADAFVSASLSETQGMTFIEAMASGIPLFARYDEVLDEILIPEKTGWFYKDPEELSSLLRQFEELPAETLARMKENCLAQVHPFSSEVFYERIIPVYEKALGVYTEMQTVEEVRVRDDFVQIWLRSEQGEETRLLMSLDDYYYLGIRKGGRLSTERIHELQQNEPAVKAYQNCLRRIAAKDRTRREIVDWLTKNSGCSEEVINQLADKLESKGYINDERYTEDAIRRMHAALRGERYIILDLERRGIPAEMIRNHLAAQPDQEYENARDYAERIQGGIRDDSVKMKQRKIKNRLMQHGYNAQVADEVIAGMDFSEDEMKEPDALRKCAAAARRRYARKYDGSQLRSAVYRYCAGQGYPSEDIYAILDEMEWDND